MTRLRLLAALIATIALAAASAPAAAAMTARLADDAWNGRKIPDGQQCTRFGGAGATPAIAVSGLPDGADGVVVALNDETYTPMDKGGHGVLGFAIAPGESALLAPVPGETNDLPAGVRVIQGHKARAAGYSPGTAYLPPCSGGMGNRYTATVSAVRWRDGGGFDVLAETRLVLGRY